jgi:hypothetical protein
MTDVFFIVQWLILQVVPDDPTFGKSLAHQAARVKNLSAFARQAEA